MSMVAYRDLTEEQKEQRRAYQRSYRARNKDKVRAWNRAFYLRQAEKINASAQPMQESRRGRDE